MEDEFLQSRTTGEMPARAVPLYSQDSLYICPHLVGRLSMQLGLDPAMGYGQHPLVNGTVVHVVDHRGEAPSLFVDRPLAEGKRARKKREKMLKNR